MEQPCVGVIGLTGQSAFMQTNHLPIPGQTVVCPNMFFEPGGKGHNQAAACARMGVSTLFVGAVGRDAWGQNCAQALQTQGVHAILLQKPKPTAFGVITTDANGENAVVVHPGASCALTPADLLHGPASKALRQCSLLVTQLETNGDCLRAVLSMAKQTGARVILNPAPARRLPPEILADCWLLTPNEEEANVLAGVSQGERLPPQTLAQKLRAAGISCAAVTLGAKGALLVTPKGQTLVPAYPVVPVDTTGAGDTFNGALVAALAGGQQLEQAVAFANAAAALCVTKQGAVGSLSTLNQVNELFYKVAEK